MAGKYYLSKNSSNFLGTTAITLIGKKYFTDTITTVFCGCSTYVIGIEKILLTNVAVILSL